MPGCPDERDRDVADISARWAASGAAGLSGRPDGPALDVPCGVIEVVEAAATTVRDLTERAGRCVALDGLALLGERAALSGLVRQGAVSCGGATRLLHAADGWLALSLARSDDIDSLPAWLDGAPPLPDVADAELLWAVLATAVRSRPVGELIERATLLGMPVGGFGEVAEGPTTAVDVVPLDGQVPPKPIDELVVVDLSALWAGPLCADLLARAGARLIKVESADRPDGARLGTPLFFDLLHAGHDSVCIDFRSEAGRRDLRRLIRRADVVIEASRPRALRQLGVDANAIDGPRVWLSITAHGATGLAAPRIGFGDDAAIAGGLATRDELGPCFCADAIADPLTGIVAASAVLEALDRGGRWRIEASLSRTARLAAAGPMTHIAGLQLAAPRAREPLGTAAPMGLHTDAVLAALG
ncbi:MAG: hypothetical protein JWN62_4689 [Acidimicrobiales bacterium]|nr:hypothetical protein [Acidimicrobiales bacterium]